MKLVFDSHGNEKQKLVYRYWADDTTTDIVYGGSKGSGKSYLGCSLIFGDALMYPETNYFIARKKLNDLRKFTIPSIHEVLKAFGITQAYYSFNGQDNVFTLYNGSKIFLLEAKHMPSDPQFYRFGSMQMTRGMIEEAGEFVEAAKNNLAASIGRWKNDVYNITGKLIQTCNPAKNYLYKQYYKAHKDNTLPIWRKFVQAYPNDNKRLPPAYLESLARVLNSSEKERLLNGNWEFDDDPSVLMDYDSIINCFSNIHVDGNGKKYITADIARFGKDESIYIVWNGWKALKIVVKPKASITENAEFIKKLKKDYAVPTLNIICDEDGVGGGVVDILGCRGFVANSKPMMNKEAVSDSKDKQVPGKGAPENYGNLKDQCSFKTAEDVNAGLVNLEAIADYSEEIIEEMEQVKQQNVDSDLKKRVVPKEKVKEMIGRSPDKWDTIMMRKWFDLFREPGKTKASLPYIPNQSFRSDFDLVR